MRLKSSSIASSTQGSTTLVASQSNPWDFKSSTIASSTQGSTTLVASQPNPWDYKSSTIASSTQGSTTLVINNPRGITTKSMRFKSSTIARSTWGSTTIGTNYNVHLDVDGGLTSFLYGLFSCQCIHILQVVDKKASL